MPPEGIEPSTFGLREGPDEQKAAVNQGFTVAQVWLGEVTFAESVTRFVTRTTVACVSRREPDAADRVLDVSGE